MSDTFIRHLIAFLGTLVALLAYWAGYQSGQMGWWWTGISVLVIYAALLKLIDT